MKKIYSKIEPETLLHIAFTDKIDNKRIDISPVDEFLQLSTFELKNGKTFKPHMHILCDKHITITQECWIILTGSVKVSYYDIDGTFLEDVILKEHDSTITFRGGHTYTSLMDNTKIYEIKNGPYNGQIADKVFL